MLNLGRYLQLSRGLLFSRWSKPKAFLLAVGQFKCTYRKEKPYSQKTFVWCFGAYLLILQFRQKYLVVNFTADSTSSQKILKESVLFLTYVVISCAYGGNSHLKQTCWLFFITYQVSEGPIPLVLFSHSSNKWIPLCIKLVVTVVPEKPSDVSFVGKEDVHVIIFSPIDCKRCVEQEKVLFRFLQLFIMAMLYWLISVSCRWLCLAVSLSLQQN